MGAHYCVWLFYVAVLAVALFPNIVICHSTGGKALTKKPSVLYLDVGSGDELASGHFGPPVDQDYPVEQPVPESSSDIEPDEGSAEDVLTECQQLRKERQLKRLTGVYVPQCTADGHFASIQCRGSTGSCWCVDSFGHRIPGTTQHWRPKLDCTLTDQNSGAVSTSGVKPGKSQVVATTQLPGSDNGFVIERKPGSPSPGNNVDIQIPGSDNDLIDEYEDRERSIVAVPSHEVLSYPGILTAIIVAVVCLLLCLVLIVMLVVYRMRKKDEGSYALCDEPKQKLAENMIREHHNASIVYTKAPASDACFA